jgi:hypothetical protein
MKLENHTEAMDYFDRASAETGGYDWKPSVAAQSLFWKGYILGEKYGKNSEAYSYIHQGYEKGWQDEFTLFYLKKYEKQKTIRTRDLGSSTPPELKTYAPPKNFGKPSAERPRVHVSP